MITTIGYILLIAFAVFLLAFLAVIYAPTKKPRNEKAFRVVSDFRIMQAKKKDVVNYHRKTGEL